jgi:[ribosomal protein S5]-alanine N-acetyltransferase
VTKILETDRLTLRQLSVEDDAFILELVNDPAWLRFIGDRGVRTLDDARAYILKGPVAMYERVGFGLYLVERKNDGVSLGICGLIKRDGLEDVDLGFAFLPEFRAQGYATESAAAVLAYGQSVFDLKRVVAITSPDNDRSTRLLEKLGFTFEKLIHLPNDSEEVKLFAVVI